MVVYILDRKALFGNQRRIFIATLAWHGCGDDCRGRGAWAFFCGSWFKLGNASSSDNTNRSHHEEAENGVNGSYNRAAADMEHTQADVHTLGSPPQRVFSQDTHSLERQVAQHRRTRETSGDTITPYHSRRTFAEVFKRLRPRAEEKPRTPGSSPKTNSDVISSSRERRRQKNNSNTNPSHQDSNVSRANTSIGNSSKNCQYYVEGPKPPPPPPLVPESTAVYELVSEDEKEDICPTCLEPYTEENPQITAKCGHTFHLSCIYEWLERSQYCPVCASVMEFEENTS